MVRNRKQKGRLLTILLSLSVLAGCGATGTEPGNPEEKRGQEETITRDDVIVTMPVTSEPESGFDPAFGWGAGEHVQDRKSVV